MTSTVRGPLPPAVYWRRRLFVLGLVAAVVLVLVGVVRGGGDDEPAARATTASGTAKADRGNDETSKSATQRAERRAARRAERRAEKKGAPSSSGPSVEPEPDTQGPAQGPAEVEPASPSGTCSDEDVAVVPRVTDAVAYRPVTIQLRLRTLTTEACTWRVSSKHLALKITDGSDEIWTSRECRFGIPISNVVVRRDLVTTVPMTWNAHRSEPTCPRQSRWAAPGDFTISAATFGGEPAESTFDLDTPPRPVITLPPRTTPKQGKKSD